MLLERLLENCLCLERELLDLLLVELWVQLLWVNRHALQSVLGLKMFRYCSRDIHTPVRMNVLRRNVLLNSDRCEHRSLLNWIYFHSSRKHNSLDTGHITPTATATAAAATTPPSATASRL